MKILYSIIFASFLLISSLIKADEGNANLSFYTGTFDVIDKEGDDKTTLFGIEHQNPDLFRKTFLGKYLIFCLSPKFIDAKLNEALSMIPLDEFPIKNDEFFNNE